MTAPARDLPRYTVQHITTARIDWSTATRLDSFSLPWEDTLPPKTEFKALWDQERLHFLFDCVDDHLVQGTGETLKERVLASDRVEIFLAPSLDLNPYYCLEMTPAGEALAYSARTYREFDWEWAVPDLHLETEVRGSRYSVQGSIPLETLRSLGILKEGSQEFYAGVYRAEFTPDAEGEVHSGWMPWVNPGTEKPDFHVPASFGIFELMP